MLGDINTLMAFSTGECSMEGYVFCCHLNCKGNCPVLSARGIQEHVVDTLFSVESYCSPDLKVSKVLPRHVFFEITSGPMRLECSTNH